jgi:hypothetical protein
VLITVEARGLAPKFFNKVSTGAERHTLTLTEGAVIRGRLVREGKPLGGMEIGLIARHRGMTPVDEHMGNPYGEIRIGTQPDGTFAIANVPKGVEWYLYGKMESLAALGATPSLECVTKDDGEDVNLGDIPVNPALRLRGKVFLSDGKPIADGMRITIGPDPVKGHGFDSQTVPLGHDGAFEFTGLRPDTYSIFASVRGYLGSEEMTMEKDVEDFKITLQPRN